ncbi:hypothetical protein, partial [Oceanivirga salmonicida]|uniref:hypothetical protein n=1 Tax=Oceanivirga salmonicida TaxID=1769291 RepID=UPI0018CC153A
FGLHHTNISVESDNIRLKNGGLIADNQLNIKTKKLETTGDKTLSSIVTKEMIIPDIKGFHLDGEKELSEDYYKSKLIGQNILLNAQDIKLKGTDILALENILLKSKNISIENDKIKIEKIKNESGNFYYKTENGKLEESKSSNIKAKNLFLDASKTIIKDSNIIVNNLKTKGDVLVTADVLENKIKLEESGFFNSKKFDVSIEKAKGSNIQVKGISEFENLSLISSKLQSKDLIVSGKLNVEAKVLKSKEKSRTSSFKFIDDVNGYVDKENLAAGGSVTLFSHKVNTKDNEYESNARAGLKVTNSAKINKIKVLSSDVVLNNADINEIESNTTKLNNKIKENSYRGGIKVEASVGVESSNVGIGLNISNRNVKGTETIHENSNISLLGNSKIEKVAKFTSTNLKYGNLVVNAKNVLFDVNKDKKDSVVNTTGINLGLNVGVSSPIVGNLVKGAKAIKNVTEGRLDKALSNAGNGFVGAVNNLSGNLKVKNQAGKYVNILDESLTNGQVEKDLASGKVKKDLSGFVAVNGSLKLKVNNVTEINHEEEVKSGTLTGGKLTFNNNEEVKYVSTIVKDTNIEYNNVGKVIKDVEVANNKKETIDVSVGVGVSTGVDLANGGLKPLNVDLSAKGSYEVKKEKLNKLNETTNVSETFNNVKDVKLKGVKSNKSTVSGNIKNLVLEDVKDEKTRKKVGGGFDISISAVTGIPTGGNVEVEYADTKKEIVHKNEISLNNLKVENLKKIELKANNHDNQISLRGGTSGVGIKVKSNKFGLDLNASRETLDALAKPDVFNKKIYLAGEEVKSKAKGLVTAIETLGVEKDNTTDKSKQEKRGLLESEQIHLNAKHDKVTKEIQNGSAKTKEERGELTKKAGFDTYIVLDEDNLPEEVIKRNKELEARGLGKLRTFVGKDKNGKKTIYTIGNLSEEEFKRDLAREYGINKYGRYVRDKNTGELKLLGATAGNIYSKYVKGTGDTKKNYLKADEVGSIGEIISDTTYEISGGVEGKYGLGYVVGGEANIVAIVDDKFNYITGARVGVSFSVGEQRYVKLKGNVVVDTKNDTVNDIKRFNVEADIDIPILDKAMTPELKFLRNGEVLSIESPKLGNKAGGSIGVKGSYLFIHEKGNLAEDAVNIYNKYIIEKILNKMGKEIKVDYIYKFEQEIDNFKDYSPLAYFGMDYRGVKEKKKK